ncbi:hypothetical protein ACP26L_06965 [Paenibacillus sp. S-38]|uniref:hypothetical protein n=1 Tax=Paenibacillus sp. S-38 TaxID=3416710 RepID=UPI003CF44643
MYVLVIGCGAATIVIKERYGRAAGAAALILVFIVILITLGFHDRDDVKAVELLLRMLIK